MTDPIQTVPLAAFEAQGERSTRIIAHMAIGWCISVVILAVVLLFAISYEVETTEETTTTSTVSQDSGDYGDNNYIGGDFYGNPAGSQNNDDQANNKD